MVPLDVAALERWFVATGRRLSYLPRRVAAVVALAAVLLTGGLGALLVQAHPNLSLGHPRSWNTMEMHERGGPGGASFHGRFSGHHAFPRESGPEDGQAGR